MHAGRFPTAAASIAMVLPVMLVALLVPAHAAAETSTSPTALELLPPRALQRRQELRQPTIDLRRSSSTFRRRTEARGGNTGEAETGLSHIGDRMNSRGPQKKCEVFRPPLCRAPVRAGPLADMQRSSAGSPLFGVARGGGQGARGPRLLTLCSPVLSVLCSQSLYFPH